MVMFNQPSIIILDTIPVQSAIWSAITNMRCVVVNRFTDPVLSGIDSKTVGIVLIDEYLNDGNGFLAIPSLRAQFKNARIIATSGNPNSAASAQRHGADLFFEKPFDWDRMNTCIRQVLEGAKSRQQSVAV